MGGAEASLQALKQSIMDQTTCMVNSLMSYDNLLIFDDDLQVYAQSWSGRRTLHNIMIWTHVARTLIVFQ